MTEPNNFKCSFCNTHADELLVLITSEKANICDQCILICVDTMAKYLKQDDNTRGSKTALQSIEMLTRYLTKRLRLKVQSALKEQEAKENEDVDN